MVPYGNSNKIKSKFEHMSWIIYHAMDEITRIRDYYNMHHNGWMTLTENRPWPEEMNGSMNVLMNQCNKTYGIKNQMDDLNDHGSTS